MPLVKGMQEVIAYPAGQLPAPCVLADVRGQTLGDEPVTRHFEEQQRKQRYIHQKIQQHAKGKGQHGEGVNGPFETLGVVGLQDAHNRHVQHEQDIDGKQDAHS